MRGVKDISYDAIYEKMFAVLEGYYPLSDDLCKLILRNSKPFIYSKGDLLLTEGRDCSVLYFISKGFCFSYYDKDGEECVIGFSEEEEFCTHWPSFLGGQKSNINIKASQETHTIVMTRDNINNLLDESREFIFILYKILGGHVIEEGDRAFIIRSNTAEGRIRYYMDTNEIYHLMKYVPQYSIASYLEMTPQVFSKKLKDIKERK